MQTLIRAEDDSTAQTIGGVSMTSEPNDSMVVELVVPRLTTEALRALAEIIQPDHPDPLAGLLQDALRTYVWVLRQQAADRAVVSLSLTSVRWLEGRDDAPEDDAPALVQYFTPEAAEALRAWLQEDRQP
jgi:hypothetical protein